MAITNYISPAELAAALSYDEATGLLNWRVRAANNVFPGDKAGALNSQGYLVLVFKKRQLQAHRIAWTLSHGAWPDGHIDHINGNRSDNRSCNLRVATQKQNCANRKIAKNNKTGFKGVRLNRGKWEASIWIEKSVYLGRFDTPEEAHKAYIREAVRQFGAFARAA